MASKQEHSRQPASGKQPPESRDDRKMWLVNEVRRLLSEDDAAGALKALEGYPNLTRHQLSEFERDMRDWGLVYGITFGLAVAKWPREPHPETAQLAYAAALMAHIDWGGEIQDPTLRREAALRTVVESYDRWDEKRHTGRYRSSDEAPIGETLHVALHELSEAVA